MPAVIAIDRRRAAGPPPAGSERRGAWCLLEVARPGVSPVPLGILLVDEETDQLILRLRSAAEIEDRADENLAQDEIDILDFLPADLRRKARESGGRALLDALEDSLSHFLRIGDRTAISWTGDAQRAADRLFEEHVDAEIRPFVRHLPFYTLRAAATKFGEGMDTEQDGWLRAPENLRLTPDMFIARVVGRSMEPLIPDGGLCVFRAGVAGSRQGRRLLIEKFGESDFASRYTVKRYTSVKKYDDDGAWEHEAIRLEPLNPEFEAFELGPDEFRVIAEFVEVLES
jgi:SOS-response transcriptional repressor LexA